MSCRAGAMIPTRQQCGTFAITLFTMLLLCSLTRTQETVTFITPPIYTAYLGQSAVEFLCSIPNATDISFLWHVNGTTLGSAELEAQGIELVIHRTIHKSGLIVSSTVANNNTRLECFGNYHDGSRLTVAQSTVATFHVQGVLGKCIGLQITSFGNYHRRLTWYAPPTLNITAVEPDISSYIVCNNISTECTTIDVTEAVGDSQDFQQYIFLNLRTYIEFTVTAVNIVGDGENTSIVTEPCEHTGGSAPEMFAAQDLSAVVTFDSNNTPSLLVEVMASQRQCLDLYLVHIEEQTDGESSGLEGIESDWIIPQDNISGNGSVTLNVTTNSTLSANTFYRATLITAMNMTEDGSIQFSTYDVQDAVLHSGRGNISIQCVFASGSQARGCHVKIRNSSTDKITISSINITRSGSQQSRTAEQTMTGLTQGKYEVLIFDWESNGSLASTPSYEGNIRVNKPASVTTSVSPTKTPTPPTTPDVVENQSPPPLTMEYIAAIAGAGAGLLLLLIIVIVVVIICRCRHRKRQYKVREKRHKELKQDVKEWEKTKEENDYKDRIYDLPVQPKKQPRIQRLDSTLPLLGSSPFYDLPSPLTTPTCTTFTARDNSETSSQPQSPDGVHFYDTADHSLNAAKLRQSKANSPSQASSSSTSEVQPTTLSPHLYTQPSKKKKPARKPSTTTTDSPSVTDGDSGRETMSPDQQLTGDENSNVTPPLPPRNYVNVDVDTTPSSGSDEKIAGTSGEPQERQSSSCVLLLEAQAGNTPDNLPCQNGTGQGYVHLQHKYPPNISIISVDSDLYSELQDPLPVMGVMDNNTGHIYQVLNQQSIVTRDDNEYTCPQDSTSDIPEQSGATSPETSDMKADVGPPLEIQDQGVQCNKVCG